MSLADTFLDLFYTRRGVGNTHSLIRAMIADPTVMMVVGRHETGRSLAIQYDLDPNRFITVNSLANRMCGRSNPLVYDLAAIEAMLESEKVEHQKIVRDLYERNAELEEKLQENRRLIDAMDKVHEEKMQENRKALELETRLKESYRTCLFEERDTWTGLQ